jgi:hypothetical protein
VKDLPPNGTVVRAKRIGWNEELTAQQLLDMDEFEYPADAVDLEGELQVVSAETDELGLVTVVLVGGQEADPATVKRVASA